MRSSVMSGAAGAFFLLGIVLTGQAPTAPPAAAPPATAAAPQGRGGGRGGPAIVSPQIAADGRVTFRVLAPQATTGRARLGDHRRRLAAAAAAR